MNALFCKLLLLTALLLSPVKGMALTLWDVDQLLARNTVSDMNKGIELRDGNAVGYAKIDHLKTLRDAHKRIGEISKVSARLAIIVNKAPNASAVFSERLIVVTTGMLDLAGADSNMVAALLAHEHAHLSLRHAFQNLLNIPKVVNSATSVGNAVFQDTRNRDLAVQSWGVAANLVAASFSRQQETEADKVGTEFMSEAKYDPTGVTSLMTAMLKATGQEKTGYFSSHPGMEQRLIDTAPTVANQQFEAIAVPLAEKKRWRALSALVSDWQKKSPDSARAWFYKGLAMRGLSRPGALSAFEKSVAADGNFSNGWLGLCVELYRVGRQKDSITCSENIPRGPLQEEYEAQTFQNPVYVGGMVPQLKISDQDFAVIQEVLKPRDTAAQTKR